MPLDNSTGTDLNLAGRLKNVHEPKKLKQCGQYWLPKAICWSWFRRLAISFSHAAFFAGHSFTDTSSCQSSWLSSGICLLSLALVAAWSSVSHSLVVACVLPVSLVVSGIALSNCLAFWVESLELKQEYWKPAKNVNRTENRC